MPNNTYWRVREQGELRRTVLCRINESKRLIEDYKRNLELNLGPLLDVLENEYGSLKQAKENVTATITKQIKGERPFNGEKIRLKPQQL